MFLDSFTKEGIIHNEDACAITNNYGFVIDGATGLLNEKVSNMATDAQWFAIEWKNFLQNNLNSPFSLQEIFKKGVLEINEKYMAFEGAQKVVSKPSCAIALYRILNNKLQYFVLGDCSLIITTTDNQVIELTDEKLSKFENQNLEITNNIAKQANINFIDATKMVTKYLLQTRLKQNTKEGYYILSNSLQAIDNAIYGELELNNVKQIIALSDGFSQIYDKFNLYSINDFAKLIENGTMLQELYNQLWQAQENDKYCNNFPRFKLRDDATIIVCKLN